MTERQDNAILTPPLHKDLGCGWVLTVEDNCDPRDPREEYLISDIYAWRPRTDISMQWKFKSAAEFMRSLKPHDVLRVIYAESERHLTICPPDTVSPPVGLMIYRSESQEPPDNVEEVMQDELNWYESYRFDRSYCMHMLEVSGSFLIDDHNHPHSITDLYPSDISAEFLDLIARDLEIFMEGDLSDLIPRDAIAQSEWKEGRWQPPLVRLVNDPFGSEDNRRPR